MVTHSSILVWVISMDRGAWRVAVYSVAKSDTTEHNTHTHKLTQTYTHAHTCTHTHTDSHTHTHTCTHTHTHTHMHSDSHTHTHAHTHRVWLIRGIRLYNGFLALIFICLYICICI